jgi:hypothetical protein
MMLVQLFTRSGALVDTVEISRHAEVISWKGKYYSFQAGRYVEGDLLIAQVYNNEPVPASMVLGSLVGTTTVTMR